MTMHPQPLFDQMNGHLLQDARPSVFFSSLDSGRLAQHPLSMLARLKDTPQSPKHHPEGSVWNHTMLVVDAAAQRKEQSSCPQVFMWAALLHDIGKPDTTRRRQGRITSYDHDKAGEKLAKVFLQAAGCPESLTARIAALVRWHMQILFVVNGLPFADVQGMRTQVDVKEIALLGLCDRLGRLGADTAAEEENIRQFLLKTDQ